jgi:hypothetical protein
MASPPRYADGDGPAGGARDFAGARRSPTSRPTTAGSGRDEAGERGRVYELGNLLPKRSSSLTEYGGLAWSPDGQEVAFCLGGADISSRASGLLLRVYALDVAAGEIRRLAEIHHAVSAQLPWNPHP